MSDEKLGYTFYQKDWWSSDTFFDLDFKERYIYLECLSLMYTGKGYMNQTKQQLEKRLRMQITDEEIESVFSRFVKDEHGYTSPTVNKRLTRSIASQKNGGKGGRPPKDKPPKEEPKLNLVELSDKLDTILATETTESLKEFIDNKRSEPPLANNLDNLENNLEKPTLLNKNNIIEIKEKEVEESKKEIQTTSLSSLTSNLRTQIEQAKGVNKEFLAIAECRKLYDSNYQAQKEGVCKREKPFWTFEQLKYFQDEFDLQVSTKSTHKVISDYAGHFSNWTAKLSKEQKQSILNKNNPAVKPHPYAHFGYGN